MRGFHSPRTPRPWALTEPAALAWESKTAQGTVSLRPVSQDHYSRKVARRSPLAILAQGQGRHPEENGRTGQSWRSARIICATPGSYRCHRSQEGATRATSETKPTRMATTIAKFVVFEPSHWARFL